MAATQSAPPPSSDDINSKNLAPTPLRATVEDRGDERAEVEKPTSTPSVFVNSEPMREGQVQNAMKFLQHPKVRGSPVVYRRSFLERKGLTKEEIDEAFRRVPDPPSNAQTATVSQDGQVNTVQPQPSNQSLQPVAGVAPPATGGSQVSTITRSRFHWSHALLAVGILVVSGAGTVVLIKNSVIPRLKSWLRKVVLDDNDVEKKINSKPSAAEEAAVAAKAAAAAASDVARASQEMLHSKNDEKKKFEECVNLLNAQLWQMKLMLSAIQKLEATTYRRTTAADQENYRISAMSSKDPPNPNQQPSNPRLVPKPKTLEDEGLNSVVQNNGATYPKSNVVPLWQKRNANIKEFDNNELKVGSSSALPSEKPIQRTWVPPQPPTVAMPGAAEAIRRPKPTIQKEQVPDEQLATQPNVTDELQKATKVSESGGATDNENSGVTSSEIQVEENGRGGQ